MLTSKAKRVAINHVTFQEALPQQANKPGLTKRAQRIVVERTEEPPQPQQSKKTLNAKPMRVIVPVEEQATPTEEDVISDFLEDRGFFKSLQFWSANPIPGSLNSMHHDGRTFLEQSIKQSDKSWKMLSCLSKYHQTSQLVMPARMHPRTLEPVTCGLLGHTVNTNQECQTPHHVL